METRGLLSFFVLKIIELTSWGKFICLFSDTLWKALRERGWSSKRGHIEYILAL
jgi:hypothetical protein